MIDPQDETTYKVCVIRSDLVQTEIPKQAVMKEVRKCRFCESAAFAIKLALEEVLTNAVKHGNRGDASKKITVRYAVTPDVAIVIVRDEGEGFEPENVPDPTTDERISIPNGRGIMLLKTYMDVVEYRDDGREVYFAKRRT